MFPTHLYVYLFAFKLIPRKLINVFTKQFESLAPQAPNLDMIRIVFEDYQCLEILQISAEMTDRTLRAFHRSCPQLRVMAVTRCPLMTGLCFGQVIGKGSIQVLDLHKSAGEGLGKIDDDFLAAIGPWLNGRPALDASTTTGPATDDFESPGGNITTINFYGQTRLSEGMLIRALESGWLNRIESLSLNHVDIGYPFLESLAEHCTRLRRLSLKTCPRATEELMQDFLKQLDALKRIPTQDRLMAPLSRFKKLYALEPGSTLNHPMLDVDDRWFGDEALDITSLWTAAVGEL